MLILEVANAGGRRYDFAEVGSRTQSRYSLRRPWHAAATIASLLMAEDRGLVTVASVSGLSCEEVAEKMDGYWDTVNAPNNLEGANIMVPVEGSVVLLPQDRDGVEDMAKFIWGTEDHWLRLIPDREYRQRFLSKPSEPHLAGILAKACEHEFAVGLEPDYAYFEIEAGPEYMRVERLIDVCVRTFNTMYT